MNNISTFVKAFSLHGWTKATMIIEIEHFCQILTDRERPQYEYPTSVGLQE